MEGDAESRLLLTAGHKGLDGEYCSGYVDALGKWNGGFYCPQTESKTAISCCGTTAFKYCCTNSESPSTVFTQMQNLPFLVRSPVLIAVATGLMLLVVFASICSCYLYSCCLFSKKRQSTSSSDPSQKQSTSLSKGTNPGHQNSPFRRSQLIPSMIVGRNISSDLGQTEPDLPLMPPSLESAPYNNQMATNSFYPAPITSTNQFNVPYNSTHQPVVSISGQTNFQHYGSVNLNRNPGPELLLHFPSESTSHNDISTPNYLNSSTLPLRKFNPENRKNSSSISNYYCSSELSDYHHNCNNKRPYSAWNLRFDDSSGEVQQSILKKLDSNISYSMASGTNYRAFVTKLDNHRVTSIQPDIIQTRKTYNFDCSRENLQKSILVVGAQDQYVTLDDDYDSESEVKQLANDFIPEDRKMYFLRSQKDLRNSFESSCESDLQPEVEKYTFL